MRLVEIHAPRSEDAACLMRELAAYRPQRAQNAVVIELDERSASDLLALLSAVETCVTVNGIRSVGVELDGQKYTLAAG
jgi:hypothetical protein